jgi:AraC family transcriptional regulator, regulatory protein of adaptative response / methylated-DNA-[protein]-cysteine methyltransferase
MEMATMLKTIECDPGQMPEEQTFCFGFAHTPVGQALIAWDRVGIWDLALVADDASGLRDLRLRWPALVSQLPDHSQAQHLLTCAFDKQTPNVSMSAVLQGTPFQQKVWRRLIELPFGERISYGELASALGMPKAARAVGSAVAANRLAFLVPCHRVVRGNGELGQFRWGIEMKRELLAWETGVLDERV